MPMYKVIISHLESQEWSIKASNEEEARDNWGNGEFEGSTPTLMEDSRWYKIVSVEELNA